PDARPHPPPPRATSTGEATIERAGPPLRRALRGHGTTRLRRDGRGLHRPRPPARPPRRPQDPASGVRPGPCLHRALPPGGPVGGELERPPHRLHLRLGVGRGDVLPRDGVRRGPPSPRPGRSSAPPTTSRPSRRRPCRSTPARTSTPSASSSTRC